MDHFEKETLAAVQAGDTGALDEVVKHYLPLVYQYIIRRVRDTALAEDLTQETFIRAWKHLKIFDLEKPFRPWLLRIARNCSFDALRRKHTVPFGWLSPAEYMQVELIPDIAASPSQQAESGESVHMVRDILAKLTPSQREVLTLHYLEELSVSEITEVVGLPLETVRSRLRRARAAFRDVCEPDMVPSAVVDSRGTYEPQPQTITQNLASNLSSP